MRSAVRASAIEFEAALNSKFRKIKADHELLCVFLSELMLSNVEQ